MCLQPGLWGPALNGRQGPWPVHRGGSPRVEAVALVLVVLVLGGVLLTVAL